MRSISGLRSRWLMGPLRGHRVLELGGIGPAPFCGMLLADFGADVVRIDRVEASSDASRVTRNPLLRGRRSIAIDLAREQGVAAALRLAGVADVVLEGFRPGVAERLGIGPDACAEHNPRLVYGRMTGWGQTGPLAQSPGHDINYVALAGVLAHIGTPDEPPVPPLNLIGDFGGGGMLLAVGVVAALVERATSGRGQVVDAAMVDGSALLMTMIFGMRSAATWVPERGANLLDGGAPFYRTYETADGRYVAVGAIEPEFYARLLEVLGLTDVPPETRLNRATWSTVSDRIAAVFRTRTRDEWCALFSDQETCFSPVLTMDETAAHPHMAERQTFVTVDGVLQPSPAPRFDRTPANSPRRPPEPGEHTREVLTDWGVDVPTVESWLRSGAVVDRRR
jgi:alpha-methylacyl-CoA racemase